MFSWESAFIYYWPTLLALVSLAAPRGLKSTLIGVVFLTLFISNITIGRLGGFYEKLGPTSFWMLHAAIAATGGVLALVFGRRLTRVLEDGAAATPDSRVESPRWRVGTRVIRSSRRSIVSQQDVQRLSRGAERRRELDTGANGTASAQIPRCAPDEGFNSKRALVCNANFPNVSSRRLPERHMKPGSWPERPEQSRLCPLMSVCARVQIVRSIPGAQQLDWSLNSVDLSQQHEGD